MSNIGGPISRSEVIARARYWLGAGLTYSQSGYAWDVDRSRQYRRDCSGMVGMAWKLAADPDTDHLPKYATEISPHDLRPGDLLDYIVGDHSHHHAILFQAWENASQFSYLSFGHTPMTEYHHATLARGDGSGTLAGKPVSAYRAFRYLHIIDGGAPTPPPSPSRPQLVVDGDFGPLTIERLQQSLNITGANPVLVVDRDFGPMTKRALQARLNKTNPPVAVDGDIGPQTVKALQRNVGATVDGDWGPQTTRALQVALNAREL